MDQAIRNKLRSVVTQCRRLLEASIAQQLQGKYDIYATGKKDEVRAEKDVPLAHLSDEEREARRDILAHFEHVEALGYRPRESLEQLIREIAFTHLNRLCAYKMMEVRDVYVGGRRFREAVGKGLKSQGFLFYLAENPEEERLFNAGEQEEAYRRFLDWLGGTLSQEIGVLFSPTDPANRVYPPQRVLDEVLDLLNSEELKGIWSEDETIGWVYQYFTPKELRDQARKESQAPRNSYELAFRNQFFTPRYVVEFLTDNTLGRIWYEMRQGRTRLADECRYMVRRPDEVFLARMTSPDEDHVHESCVEAARLLSEGDEASFPPFDGSEGSIQRMIDMAHVVSAYDRHGDEVFGWDLDGARHAARMGELSTQSILDLLFATCRADRQGMGGNVYGEPWFVAMANEARRRSLAARDSDLKTEERLRLPVFVPYRAKKDPREIKILDPACGSGHFLLYGFALLLVIYEEAYDDPDLGPGLQGEYATKDDLRRAVPGLILRHNLHGIDIDLRCTQIAALALWLRCQRAYQEMRVQKDRPQITRSNIVCAEPMPGEGHMLKEFVAQIEPRLLGQLVEVVFDKMKLAGEAGSLLKIEEEIREAVAEARRQWRTGPVATQMRLFGDPKPVIRQQQFDLSGITEAQFFEQAESKVVDALRSYSEQAQNGERLQWRLFADDAVRGFAFVDLCHKRFDIVMMNPPFGETTTGARSTSESLYPFGKSDLAMCFVERAQSLLSNAGRVGVLATRTIFFQPRAEGWRKNVLHSGKDLECVADLGYGVLDNALVETAAFTLGNLSSIQTTWIQLVSEEHKQAKLAESVLTANQGGGSAQRCFIHDYRKFSAIPGNPFCYSAPKSIIDLFETKERFENDGRFVRCGMGTLDDFRFLRCWWEVDGHHIARSRPGAVGDGKWVPFAKGGIPGSFTVAMPLVVNFHNSGYELKQFVTSKVGSASRKIQAESFYFRPGLTFGRRIRKFSPYCLPEGSIFSDNSHSIFINGGSRDELKLTLAILNSDLVRSILSLYVPIRKMEAGYLQRLPIPSFDGIGTGDRERVISAIDEACNATRWINSLLETDHFFYSPASTWDTSLSFSESLVATQHQVDSRLSSLHRSQNAVDRMTVSLYEIQDYAFTHSRDVDAATSGCNDNESIEDEDEMVGPAEVSLSKLVGDCISYVFGCIYGRWNVLLTNSMPSHHQQADHFAPLPICSPGAFQRPGPIVEQSVGPYPLKLVWDGILTDDPDNPDDIIHRVRDVLEVIWKDRADAIEKEACEILGVADLRDYFRKPGAGGFWDDHIKRYSKSRRKAPIYWLLQSSKKNYALWIYYHRLDKDILFKALLNYVEPKIRKEVARLGELRSQKAALGPAAKGAKKFDKDIDRHEAFLSELRDFEDKLRRAANLHLDPDLDDGVVLNIAPLRELVPWKEAKFYWDELMDGKYEWSSIGKQLREKGLVS